MNQWRWAAAVAVVALGSAAVWLWYQQSSQIVTTRAVATAAAPLDRSRIPWAQQEIPVNQPPAAAAKVPAPPVPPPTVPAGAADATATLAAAAVEPSPVVDTPEPAQLKFTHGRRPESDQN